MTPTLEYWQLKAGQVVRLDPIGKTLAVLLKPTSGRWDYRTMLDRVGTGHVFYAATEEDLAMFLRTNTIENMPREYNPTKPEETIERLKADKAAIDAQLAVLEQYHAFRVAREREKKRQASDVSRQSLEEKSRQMFSTLRQGDLVRVVGVRDSRYRYRLVDEIIGDSFKGFQYGKNRQGKWVRGDNYTTHMSTKIREVIPKGQWDA